MKQIQQISFNYLDSPDINSVYYLRMCAERARPTSSYIKPWYRMYHIMVKTCRTYLFRIWFRSMIWGSNKLVHH